MSAGASTMTDEERARLFAVIAEETAAIAQQHTGADGLTFELGANVATARTTATAVKSPA
jgi:hypothetical protein